MKLINKKIVPLSISMLLMFVSIGVVFFSNYKLNFRHYIGFGLLITSCFFYFKNKNIYVIFFGIILFLGFIGLINFYYTSIIVELSFLKFNPIFMILLILFLAVNKDDIDSMFPDRKKNTPSEPNKKLIQNFKLKFKEKSIRELQNIVKDKSKYSTEAKIAAKLILKEE